MVDTGAKSQLIVRVPGIHGGEPVIRGTRVPVRSVVVACEQYNGDLAKVGEAFLLGLEAIQAALAYYDAHRDEIDKIIQKRERAALR